MKNLLRVFIALLLFIACQNKDEQTAAALRENEKQEEVFSVIKKNWRFTATPVNDVSQRALASWPAWRSFVDELSNTPQLTIGAFRRKSNTLSLRAAAMADNIPAPFNVPEIQARIAVICTKVNALSLFMGLQQIPKDSVIAAINAINREVIAVQDQMAEIIRKANIPKEIGEEDMIKMLDTARAIKE